MGYVSEIELSKQQRKILEIDNDVLVRACPGSGKTRLLTAKLLQVASVSSCPGKRVAALTFTNRAADEIERRIHDAGYDGHAAWTGTVHAFAIEWILRPFAGYHQNLRYGFNIADEFLSRERVDSLRSEFGIGRFETLTSGYNRDGRLITGDSRHQQLLQSYRESLARQKLVDFDQVLLFAYEILINVPFVAKNLGSIFSWLCIDEYQDTQDLQYAILSAIVRASEGTCKVFVVGDQNQAIYMSLGSRALGAKEICEEFGFEKIVELELSFNYRSTQRIVDYCSRFNPGSSEIESLAEYRDERGIVSFADLCIQTVALPEYVASIIKYHRISGIPESEICVVGPTWQLVIPFGRRLASLLPECSFDALGLSPIRHQQDSVWYQLARLLLTDPEPKRYLARRRWASQLIKLIEESIGCELSESSRCPSYVLRCCNSIARNDDRGLEFLDQSFSAFFSAIDISDASSQSLTETREAFFSQARTRISQNSLDSSLEGMKRMFRYPQGIVVNTCHGVKGEEYSVVIAFGIHQGRIPHQSRISNPAVDDELDARNLLYVISSRAKRFLHLIAESGRTIKNRPCQATRVLTSVTADYDDLAQFI